MRDRQVNKPTWTRTFKFTLPVLLFSIVYMIPEFFEFSIQRHNVKDIGNSTDSNNTVVLKKFVHDGFTNISTKIVGSDFTLSETYVLAYFTVGNFIITGLIPLIMLAYFNFYIYFSIFRKIKPHYLIRFFFKYLWRIKYIFSDITLWNCCINNH